MLRKLNWKEKRDHEDLENRNNRKLAFPKQRRICSPLRKRDEIARQFELQFKRASKFDRKEKRTRGFGKSE